MKIALGVAYNGQFFNGWQAQDNLTTVQGELEKALSFIADSPVKLFCAGRTDAGVHAAGQIAHFETTAERDLRAWTVGVNSYLPASISIEWAQIVDETFHARFSAIARRYRYVIHNHSVRSALLAGRVTNFYALLDDHKMQEAANYLLGENDFTSFRSSQCESNTPMRNVHFIQVKRVEDLVIIDIQANAFLHHMVRNIAGVLMVIGAGWKPPIWAKEVLEAKDRKQAGETARPEGLYLTHVIYPDLYVFPKTRNAIMPPFLDTQENHS